MNRMNKGIGYDTAAALAAIFVIGAAPSFGQCEAGKLMTADGEDGFRFATSVALAGDTIAVASEWDDNGDPFSDIGSVTVYTTESGVWNLQQRIEPADGSEDDEFGKAVAIEGDTLIVGSPGDDDGAYNAGAVYIFERSDGVWTRTAKLTASDPEMNVRFGSAVALAAGTLIVGAPDWSYSGVGLYSGRVYIFELTDDAWTQKQHVEALDKQGYATFGESLAFDGSRILIGASGDGTDGDSYMGAAYIFEYDGLGDVWEQTAKLTASDGTGFDYFGHSVAMSGGAILVGAWSEGDAEDEYPGAAYFFDLVGDAWVQATKVRPSDAGTTDRFGFSVALADDVALIGAPNDPIFADSPRGSAYLLERIDGEWTETASLQASDVDVADAFGWSVTMTADLRVVGQIGAPYLEEGAAYIFSELGEDCNDNGVCDARDIDEGTSLDDNGNGIPDECEDDSTPGDLDGDGDVDVFDLLELLEVWGTCPDCPADLDGDGDVDVFDLLMLLENWG